MRKDEKETLQEVSKKLKRIMKRLQIKGDVHNYMDIKDAEADIKKLVADSER